MSEFEGKLAVLREQFIRNAAGKLEILEASIARLAADRSDRAMLDRTMRVFHSFGGIGTTYGFPEITRAGRAGEKLCDQVVAEERSINDEEIGALRSELQAIVFAIHPSGEADHAGQSSAQRILLLDENPEEAAFIRMVLESTGYEVRVCENSGYLAADMQSFAPELLLSSEGSGPIEGARCPSIVICDAAEEDTVPMTKLRRPLTPSILISTVASVLQPGDRPGQ